MFWHPPLKKGVACSEAELLHLLLSFVVNHRVNKLGRDCLENGLGQECSFFLGLFKMGSGRKLVQEPSNPPALASWVQ